MLCGTAPGHEPETATARRRSLHRIEIPPFAESRRRRRLPSVTSPHSLHPYYHMPSLVVTQKPFTYVILHVNPSYCKLRRQNFARPTLSPRAPHLNTSRVPKSSNLERKLQHLHLLQPHLQRTRSRLIWPFDNTSSATNTRPGPREMPANDNIWIACSDGNLATVTALLTENPSLVNARDDNGCTLRRPP